MKREFQVIVELDEDGFYVAEVPGVCACYAQGRTFEEAIANVRDVLDMCIAEFNARGVEVPAQSEIIGVKRIEAEV
jgi:predicted RNase H-like HicB family nuclease